MERPTVLIDDLSEPSSSPITLFPDEAEELVEYIRWLEEQHADLIRVYLSR